MPNQMIIFILSIIGVLLFFVRFQKLKKYFSVYSEIFGIAAIIYILNSLIGYYFYNLELNLYIVLMALITLIRNTILASLATFYFYEELKVEIVPYVFNRERKEREIVKVKDFYLATIILGLIILFSMMFILLSGNPIFVDRDISWDMGFYTALNSFLISFGEEVFVRLYLFGIIAYWLRKFRWNFVIAAVLSTLLWTFDHYQVDVMAMKFLFLFIMGMLLSVLAYKKGIENCIVVHGLYNTLAFISLGYMR